MRSVIYKELQYALRSGRIFILSISFLFFALLTPVMLKVVLPQILSSQFAGETAQAQNISSIMDMTQLGCIQSYMGDVFEIGIIIISFTLCGLLASEIQDNTLVLPLCSGKRFGRIVSAKLLVFGILLLLIPVFSLLADYIYSGLLFDYEIGILPILYGGLLQGIYMQFLIACLLMWGAIMRKPIATGFLTLATAYGIHFTASLLQIQQWTPSGLLVEAGRLAPGANLQLLIPLAVTIISITLMISLTLSRLKRLEWNARTT
jgi:hypothetical protein